MLPARIAQMMAIDNLELRTGPERRVAGWEIVGWHAAIYCGSSSSNWVWADGQGDTMEEAVADLLERHADEIEKACQELEEDGYVLPKAA